MQDGHIDNELREGCMSVVNFNLAVGKDPPDLSPSPNAGPNANHAPILWWARA